MDKTELYIFSRLYQSYVMGGDSYSFLYKTDDENKIRHYKTTIDALENKGLLKILFQSDKKTRMALTDKGIDYGNSIID